MQRNKGKINSQNYQIPLRMNPSQKKNLLIDSLPQILYTVSTLEKKKTEILPFWSRNSVWRCPNDATN